MRECLRPGYLLLVLAAGCGGEEATMHLGDLAAGAAGRSGDAAGRSGDAAGQVQGGTQNSAGRIDLVPPTTDSTCPSSCESLNADCGTVTDTKCGGVIECGACADEETCGAAGPNRCGRTGSGLTCAAQTCTQLDANCGAIGDGCGKLLDCGACSTDETCGAGGPNRCGGGSCEPKTCADLGFGCGLQGDSCGNRLDCGSCEIGEQCITTNGKSQCVGLVCKRKSCEALGYECGPVSDGCSGTQNCGSCGAPKSCGGGDQPGKCGCKGVCGQIPNCPAGKTTSIRGKVYDPAGAYPLPGALVYIPNNPVDPDLKPFSTRPSTCDVCGAAAAGDPLVSTHTAVDGSFTLDGVPAGDAVALVVQLGRWRRIFEVNIASPCELNALPNDGKLTLPKNKAEGDIPRFAVVTGRGDAMECVLLKMGIDAAEFTNPTDAGRVHLYTGSGVSVRDHDYDGRGVGIDRNTPSELALFAKDNQGNLPLTNYDVLVLSSQGSDFGGRSAPSGDANDSYLPSLAYWSDLVNYANGGGRIFATAESYRYLQAGGSANPFLATANWIAPSWPPPSGNHLALIVTDPARNPKGREFADWLALPEVGVLSSVNPPAVTLEQVRAQVRSVVPPSVPWTEIALDSDPSAPLYPLHYSFNTPVGKDTSCGRVVQSASLAGIYIYDPSEYFPQNCAGAGIESRQVAIFLEYLLFDVSTCVTPYVPLCTPKSCAEQNISCGKAGDGCGGAIDCGSCGSPEICGLVTPGKCGTYACTPQSCATQHLECGAAGDGCGAGLDCGDCPAGQTCGGGGPGQCGTGSCTPRTCADQGIECGWAGDGCGGPIDCGTCSAPAICGYGGPGQCGTPGCTPMTCSQQGIECGAAGDGCGAELLCGSCGMGQVCGLEGPGRCGKPPA